LKKLLANFVIEEKKFSRNPSTAVNIREKEDKEPVLMVCFPKDKLFLTFGNDFELQSFINSIVPLLKS